MKSEEGQVQRPEEHDLFIESICNFKTVCRMVI